MVKSPSHLRNVRRDIDVLKKFAEFLGRETLIEEVETVKPVFGSYLSNILAFEKAHFIALSQTRNILIAVTILLIGLSYIVGLIYMAINIVFFLITVVLEIPASAKNNKHNSHSYRDSKRIQVERNGSSGLFAILSY